MNILYLIGNGFDIARGYKTRYTDFYPYYVDRAVTDHAVEKICNEIGKDFNTWADLEYRLGQYCAEIPKEDFENVYYDLSDRLQEYLKTETARASFEKQDLNKLYLDIAEPFKYLSGIDNVMLKAKFDSDLSHHINIISFNYTDVLDKALSKNSMIGSASGANLFLDNIYHIHGVLGQTIILGVNDETQIANEDFVGDDDIKDLLVKPQSNESMRSSEAIYCRQLVERADVIILYGLSIGETDRYWWELIGRRMLTNHDVRTVVFKYDEDPLDQTKAQKFGSKRRLVINDFMNKMGIKNADEVKERIYVSFDRSFLALGS